MSPSLWLPDGRMHLIDRILTFEPYGGAHGKGMIRAEADVHPDDWYLTCHFVDDMVMPGTLMYECCAHTLRVFMQRIGWISANPEACYEPLTGVESVLKCRGPVTPRTRSVVYEIELKELGYGPEPYAIADARMWADGAYIVFFDSISMKLSHATRSEIETLWGIRHPHSGQGDGQTDASIPAQPEKMPVFSRRRLEEFASGLPSRAFGEPYQDFDLDRFLARLPQPPYLLMDRVVAAEPRAWELKPDGWIEAHTDVTPDSWYFRANRAAQMPFCVLNEIALQPCGWLAAYMGSALRSNKDLRFRNLGGAAQIHADVWSKTATLKTRARLTRFSEAGDMIIEHFEFKVSADTGTVYQGHTHFGFFTRPALADQVGLKNIDLSRYSFSAEQSEVPPVSFADIRPLTPDDPEGRQFNRAILPATAIRMIDRIDVYSPDGGPHGLGFVSASKTTRPDEWFFKAHFLHDPVCPGSLGLESLVQLMKYMLLQRWPNMKDSHCFSLISDIKHEWTYRGQIIPANRDVGVSAIVTRLDKEPSPRIWCDGLLRVDGMPIYEMKNFCAGLAPRTE